MIRCCLSRSICAARQLQPVRANSRCWVVKPARPINRTISIVQKGKRVRYAVDRMTLSDVPRVVEIERLAYPSTWPPSAYRKELQDNRWAHYIVLRDKHIMEEQTATVPPEAEKPRKNRLFPLSLLPNRPTP